MGKGRPVKTPLTTGYHGSATDLPVGGKILPSAKAGANKVHQSLSSPEDSYFTKNEESAWHWANAASSAAAYRASDRGLPIPPFDRPVVYKTKPDPQQHLDANLTSDRATDKEASHFVTPSQEITGRIDIPTPTDRSSVQGTLPPVNWNQFQDPSNPWPPSGDWNSKRNHHSPYPVEHGEFPESATGWHEMKRQAHDESLQRAHTDAAWLRAGQQSLPLEF
jgi:hypothetical protein